MKQKNQDITSKKNNEFITVKKAFHPLAKQTLGLRESLNLPLPKIKESNNFNEISFTEENPEISKNLPLNFFISKDQEIQSLTNILRKIQTQKINLDSLNKKIKEFNIKDKKAHLLVLSLPLEDRKILSDLSDFVLYQLDLSILIVFGESQTEKHPVFVNLNKKFSSILSAGDILKKDIAPLMNGRGGGKAHFAQGSIQDKTKINKLDSLLNKKMVLNSSIKNFFTQKFRTLRLKNRFWIPINLKSFKFFTINQTFSFYQIQKQSSTKIKTPKN